VFINNVSPSWLIIIDESMVKWVGVGMPGVMVVPQKPTPMGLELHTVCCAVSGILINFELYEGKERMGLKQCVGEPTEFGPINKSTALPLRCVQPWFSTVVRPRHLVHHEREGGHQGVSKGRAHGSGGRDRRWWMRSRASPRRPARHGDNVKGSTRPTSNSSLLAGTS